MGFGRTPDGVSIERFELSRGGLTVGVIPYGAIVTEIHAPDRQGRMGDVVLGFGSLEGYLGPQPYFGAVIGRVANRIAGGRFALDGREYTLAVNNGPNSLHGGLRGFDKAVWAVDHADAVSIDLSHRSPDGDEGYPGNLAVRLRYSLMPDASLKIDYEATTDRATPVNLTNHSYFHLGGPGTGTVLDHEVFLAADAYTPVDETLIPTGALSPVAGTALDFTRPKRIGADIAAMGGEPGGYDHNFVLRAGGLALLAARVRETRSGRVLEVFTTEPGLQLYTGNFLDGSIRGKGGVAYEKQGAFCLEAQHFPDSVHHPEFPSVILRPGGVYRQTTVYRFSVD